MIAALAVAGVRPPQAVAAVLIYRLVNAKSTVTTVLVVHHSFAGSANARRPDVSMPVRRCRAPPVATAAGQADGDRPRDSRTRHEPSARLARCARCLADAALAASRDRELKAAVRAYRCRIRPSAGRSCWGCRPEAEPLRLLPGLVVVAVSVVPPRPG